MRADKTEVWRGIPKPNFFLMGTPRSGTTSMYRYLQAHPQIFLPHRKEPGFYRYPLKTSVLYPHTPPWFVLEEEHYAQLFAPAKGKKIIGEASVGYILMEHALRNIHAECGEVKVLIMLRNFAEVICRDLYHQICITDGITVSEAFKKQERDARSHPDIMTFRDALHKLPENIALARHLFGKENVKIILFGDLEADAAKTYHDVLNFLEVDACSLPTFPIHNSIKQSHAHSALRRTLASLARRCKIPEKIKNRLRPMVERASPPRLVQRPAFPPDLTRALDIEFMPVIKRLELITGQNLTALKHYKG